MEITTLAKTWYYLFVEFICEMNDFVIFIFNKENTMYML